MFRFSRPLLAILLLCWISATLSSTVPARRSAKKNSAPTKAKYSRNSNPTDAFCKKFIAKCYQLSLDGQSGHVKVVHSCQRNGNKYSSSYSFGCKAGNVDKTSAVLNAIGGSYTYTTTVSGSTAVVTGTVTAVVTSTALTTSEVDVTTVVDATTTEIDTITNTNTATTTETATIATAIPVTVTSTSTSSVTSTVPVTSTVATSTVTSVFLATNTVPILQVAVQTPPVGRRRSNTIDSSPFCTAFNTACTTQCKRVNSTPNHVLCHSTSPLHYSLTCYCKNGKVETQHALAAVKKQQNIVTVSTVSTSTSYATVTSTTVVPSTILSTSMHTITSTIPITKTYTSLSTVTQTSSTTTYPGVSTTVATEVPTTTATAFTTTTIATTATSTTQLVLAATGVIQAISTTDQTIQGYINYDPNDSQFFYTTTDKSSAIVFMAVIDPASGLYQLQLTDGSGNVFVAEAGFDGDDYSADGSAYSWTYPGPPSLCGTAGVAAGPPAGSGYIFSDACETFVFGPTADAETLAEGETIVLEMEWWNPSATSANQYSWTLDSNVKGLYSVSNVAAFSSAFNEPNTPVALRFPA